MAKEYTGGTPFTGSSEIWSPSTDRGYDVLAPKISDARRAVALERVNATLHNGTNYISFFCKDIEMDLGLAGTTGQGKNVRDFYPHNVILPSLKVEGQTLDQQDYGNLIEFIHVSQRNSIGNGKLTQLKIKGMGISTKRKIMKGPHKPILAQGVIKKIDRIHERWVYQPDFQFEFVLAEMVDGIYKEALTEVSEAKTYMEIVQSLSVEKPEQKAAAKSKSSVATQKPNNVEISLEEEIFPHSDVFGPNL